MVPVPPEVAAWLSLLGAIGAIATIAQRFVARPIWALIQHQIRQADSIERLTRGLTELATSIAAFKSDFTDLREDFVRHDEQIKSVRDAIAQWDERRQRVRREENPPSRRPDA